MFVFDLSIVVDSRGSVFEPLYLIQQLEKLFVEEQLKD